MTSKGQKSFLNPPTLIGRIKEYMELNEITPYRMAKLTNVSFPQIAKWTSGALLPSLTSVYKIANAMDIKIGDLLPENLEDLK